MRDATTSHGQPVSSKYIYRLTFTHFYGKWHKIWVKGFLSKLRVGDSLRLVAMKRASRNASDPDLSKKLNWEINCLISNFNPQRLQKGFLGCTTYNTVRLLLFWEISHFPRTLKVKLYLIDNSRFLYNNNLHQEYPCCMIFYLFLPFEFSLNNYTYLC